MKFVRYENRFQAGEILTEQINKEKSVLYQEILNDPESFFCFAIPNGGIPVAEGLCSKFRLNYSLIIVRKVKIPWNTEAGLGSVTTDGTVLINKPLLEQLNLSKQEMERAINITKNEIKERLELYNIETDLETFYHRIIKNKNILIVDDGLASGYTMLAGINMIKKYLPSNIYIAVPTAPLHTVQRIKKEVNHLFCPNIRDVFRFAVAEAYKKWYDISETEAINFLKNSKYFLKKEK